METKLTDFLGEISKIHGLLNAWNITKANDWFFIKRDEVMDTIRIHLTPNDHDYLCNGQIEEVEKIVDENSKLSWHTYHIDVITILVEKKDGHMIQAIAPEIVLNFYMYDNEK